MASKQIHRTNKYRQLDTAVRAALGASPRANVTSVSMDPVDENRLWVTFDQPMSLQLTRGAPPEWTFGDGVLGVVIEITHDGRSAKVTSTGAPMVGDAYGITATPNGGQLNSIIGGGINESTGYIADAPIYSTFDVVSCTHVGTDKTKKTFHFDAPIARMAALDFEGWSVGSATVDSLVSMTNNSAQVQLSTSANIGTTWIVPQGTTTPDAIGTAFISITAARLNSASGVST